MPRLKKLKTNPDKVSADIMRGGVRSQEKIAAGRILCTSSFQPAWYSLFNHNPAAGFNGKPFRRARDMSQTLSSVLVAGVMTWASV